MLQTIKFLVQEAFSKLKRCGLSGRVRLMFEDKAGFGRINKPKYCCCVKGLRPLVPCRHIREYRYCYGAVYPIDGESFSLIMPWCNTEMMNLYLAELSKRFPDDIIVLPFDGAGWHRSGELEIPENICIFLLPPATPEMNPTEQIWKELRARGFRNKIFASLKDVGDRLCKVILALKQATVRSIKGR